jgi:hypothetical protein
MAQGEMMMIRDASSRHISLLICDYLNQTSSSNKEFSKRVGNTRLQEQLAMTLTLIRETERETLHPSQCLVCNY